MQYRSDESLRVLAIGVFAIVIAVIVQATVHSDVLQDQGDKKATTSETPSKKAPAPKANLEKSKEPTVQHNEQKPQAHASPAKKKQLALSLLDEVLAGADKIDPVEYRALVQVEAATILWPLDKERSVSILKSAVKAMRDLLDEESQSKKKKEASKNRQTLRSLVLRKIAALKPDLLKKLADDSATDDKPKPAISKEWTEEARALISVAADQIAKDPKLAAQLAEQTLPLGMTYWTGFLDDLSQRDPGEAERLATTILNRMRSSSIDPGYFDDLRRFVLGADRSPELKEFYFQAMAAQFRLTMRPDKTEHALTGDLYTARGLLALAAARFPKWQPEYADIVSTIEAMFTQRSLPVPGPPKVRMVDPSAMNDVKLGDTQEISSALSRVEAIKDSQARDREYQQLAVQAGLKTDLSLAESILSKIEDEEARRQTSTKVYRPLVRKAVAESAWSSAQTLALNVLDPLGRTLLIDYIAQAMIQAHQDRSLVMEVYRLATTRLEREEATQTVAKAFLILEKSLLPIDPEASMSALDSAVWVLNKVAKKDETLAEASAWEAANGLVRVPNRFLDFNDVLVLPDLLGNGFNDWAKRNADKSLTVADGLAHRGLYALARLAISKALLEASYSPEHPAPKNQSTVK